MLLGDISARHDINLCKDESLFSENETNDREMSTPRVLEDRTGVEFSSSNKEKTSSTSDNTPRSNVRLVDTIQGNQDLSTRRQSVSNRSVQQVKRLKQAGVQSDNKGVNLSFCGCGFLGIYHVGVASCFHQYAPRLSMNKIAGSSAGALVAMSHICGNLQLAYCTTDILTVAIEARSRTLGSFHPSFDIQAQVREALERGIPKDAYLKANGVLHVSLTRVEDGANVIVSEFESNEDLIQVLLCSCFIPLWSGLRFPKFKGVHYIDGGFSDNLLILDDKTVTVSPFSGEADICPQDDFLNYLQVNISNTSFSISPNNLYRLSHALLPPEPEALSELCKQGFADGIRYLQRMNLISCTKCLEIRSSLLITTGGEDMREVFSTAHRSSSVTYHASKSSTCDPNNNNNTTTNSSSSNNNNICEIKSIQQQIVLEQQEQETIEIDEIGRGRSGSIVSITSTSHKFRRVSTTRRDAQFSLAEGTNSGAGVMITPAASLHNLLNGIEDESNFDSGDKIATIDDCNECVLIRQRALYDPLPKQFSDRILEASDKVNKSLSKWLYSHRPVKYLSYLMLPYYIPIDLTLAIVRKFWRSLPTIRLELGEYASRVLDLMLVLLKRMQTRSTSAMLMGYGASWEEDILAYEKELARQKRDSIEQLHQYKQQQHHHHYHHHHHHHHHHHLQESGAAGKFIGVSSHFSNDNNSPLASHQHSLQQERELHSLEDTFDSIVDVTSNQEARIFAYYFRDAKHRLQVTEFFDHEQVAPAASIVSGQNSGSPPLEAIKDNKASGS